VSTQLIEIIDARQFGLPETGAVYLIRGSCPLMIESGTAASVSIIRDALGELAELAELAECAECAEFGEGDKPSPDYIFLTHVHLDHAGGAGHLARAYPQTKIVVHESGYRHLVDPSRLIESVRSASPDLFSQYGKPIPVPEHQLLSVTGGEVFDLGEDVRLEVIAAPGHARHHVCFFEHNSRTLFTGDAVGHWNKPVEVPLTVPPRFDLTQSLATLRALKQLRPKRLAFTHFGFADNALAHIDHYERQLIDWFEDLRGLLKCAGSAEVVEQVLGRARYVSLSKIDRDIVAMCVRGAILSLEAGAA